MQSEFITIPQDISPPCTSAQCNAYNQNALYTSISAQCVLHQYTALHSEASCSMAICAALHPGHTTFHPRMCPPEEILRGAQNISFAADILCTTYLLRDQVKVFSVPFFVMQLNWKQTSSKQSSTKFKLSCIGRNCTITQLRNWLLWISWGATIAILRFCFCVQSSVLVVE